MGTELLIRFSVRFFFSNVKWCTDLILHTNPHRIPTYHIFDPWKRETKSKSTICWSRMIILTESINFRHLFLINFEKNHRIPRKCVVFCTNDGMKRLIESFCYINVKCYLFLSLTLAVCIINSTIQRNIDRKREEKKNGFLFAYHVVDLSFILHSISNINSIMMNKKKIYTQIFIHTHTHTLT